MRIKLKASKELELLVQRIQKQLAPKAVVLHDVKLPGRNSGVMRQIDVLVQETIGQYTINIIIDCKDYKNAIDVKGVEEFAGLLHDVGGQKGVLVCPKGFTKSAKTRAEGLQIDLYSPVDTDPHKWQVKATIPTICDFRSAAISFGIMGCSSIPLKLDGDFFSSQMVYDETGDPLGTSLEVIAQRWNDGEIIDVVGDTGRISIFGDRTTLVDNGYGAPVPVKLYAKLFIEKRIFYGQLPVPQISGFKDEMSGHVITNAFEVGLLDPEVIEKEWLLLKNESDAPVRPVITLRGVVAWVL